MPTDDNNKLIDDLARYIKQGEQVADIAGGILSTVRKVIELTRKNAGDAGDGLVAKENHWTSATDRPSLEERLEARKEEKRAYLSEITTQTSKYLHDHGSQLPAAPPLRVLSQAVQTTMTMVDPFLSTAVNAGVVAIDGYLTRQALRDESARTRAVMIGQFGELRSTIEQCFDELSFTFTWVGSEMMWRQDVQNALLKRLVEATLNPRKIQVAEDREQAIERYNVGLFDSVLKLFTKASENADGDFASEHYIGNIYLFSKKHRNYEKAAEHFGIAADYAYNFPLHRIYAWMHKGLAHYLSGSSDDPGPYMAAAEALEQAVKLASRAQASHFIPELKYQLAQYCVVSGNVKDAMKELREVLEAKPSYVVKVLAEDDFLLAKQEVLRLIEGAVADLHRSISEQLDRHDVFLALARRDCSGYYDQARLGSYMDELKPIVELFAKGDFESLLNAKGRLESLSIPVSHPRFSTSRIYSHSNGLYSVRAHPYMAPYYSRGPYREQLWAMGGELL